MNANHFRIKYVVDLVYKFAVAIGKSDMILGVLYDNPYEDVGIPSWSIEHRSIVLRPKMVEMTVTSLKGKETKMFPGFVVEKGVTIPGCHTLHNGDPGYPDDYDYVTVIETPSLAQAVKKLVLTPIELDADMFLDGWFQSEMVTNEPDDLY